MRPAPPEYKTHIYPMAQLGALKFDPDLTVLRQDNRSRTHKHEQRETLNEQARAARDAEQAAREAAQEMWTVCASNEHDFSSCTKCRLCKNDGHWAQDCPEARKAD